MHFLENLCILGVKICKFFWHLPRAPRPSKTPCALFAPNLFPQAIFGALA